MGTEDHNPGVRDEGSHRVVHEGSIGGLLEALLG